MHNERHGWQRIIFVLLLSLATGCGGVPASPQPASSIIEPTVVGEAPPAQTTTIPSGEHETPSTQAEVVRVLAKIPVGTGTYGIAAGEGAIWASSSFEQSIKRIDPRTNQVVATINEVGTRMHHLAVGAGALWVAGETESKLLRIDTGTNQIVQTIQLPGVANAIAVEPDAVWIGTLESLVRVDPRTNQVVATIKEIKDAGSMVRHDNQLWGSTIGGTRVFRLDPRTNRVAGPAITLPHEPHKLATGMDAVWATHGHGSEGAAVTRLDPQNGQVVTTVTVNSNADAAVSGIAILRDAVWATTWKEGTISRIDPATNQITATSSRITFEINEFMAAEGSLWATDGTDGHLLRIEPSP
jgi:streptogramin lyase